MHAQNTPERWLELADEAHAVADEMQSREAQQLMHSIARGYERIAELKEKAPSAALE
jgi:hypothetical protein